MTKKILEITISICAIIFVVTQLLGYFRTYENAYNQGRNEIIQQVQAAQQAAQNVTQPE